MMKRNWVCTGVLLIAIGLTLKGVHDGLISVTTAALGWGGSFVVFMVRDFILRKCSLAFIAILVVIALSSLVQLEKIDISTALWIGGSTGLLILLLAWSFVMGTRAYYARWNDVLDMMEDMKGREKRFVERKKAKALKLGNEFDPNSPDLKTEWEIYQDKLFDRLERFESRYQGPRAA